jgi:hypothetical protein
VPSTKVAAELSFAQARAHAALDEARTARWKSEEHQAKYFAAIAVVDRVDPGFYLGRWAPALAPRPFRPLADVWGMIAALKEAA